MTGLGILVVLWIVGLVAYFHFTTERQRENVLLFAWIASLVPTAIFLVMGMMR